MTFNKYWGISLLVLSAFFNPSVNATPVTGQANLAGNVTVFDGVLQFAPIFVTAGAVETGSFAGLTGGTIQSLTGGPTTGNVDVPAFISFSAGLATPVIFNLTNIAPGVGTVAGCSSAALGSLCTPTRSPFTLLQLTSNTVVVSLQLDGNSYTGTSATGMTPTSALFSTQSVVPGTIPQIIAILQSGGAISGATYSASFNTSPNPVVPEPSTILLLGAGLLGGGLLARRKKA